jgi:hypothetical protein
MRTTLDINDAVLRDLRARAREKGCPFRQVVEDALALGLAQESKGGSRRRFEVKPHRLGLKPGFGGVSLNQLYDQLEAERGGGMP